MSKLFYDITLDAIRATYGMLKPLNKLSIKVEGKFPEEPSLLTLNHFHKIRFWFFGWHNKWADHLLTAYLPTDKIVHFAVQDRQYMKPFTRFILERLETFPAKSVRKGIKYARKGEMVAIFPQGEAHKLYENKYYKGAAFMAQRGNVDITPLKISSKGNELIINILPKIASKGKTLEQLTQEIEEVYSE
ncbi:MAG: 1-acyl-sn-glycerol-3-phosphate acyltransferase [archaeon]